MRKLIKFILRYIPRPIKRTVRRGLEKLWRFFVPEVNHFLKKIDGLIHVGANSGQEREVYAASNLKVLWVEPIPEIFAQLEENIRNYPRQCAVQSLVTDQDDVECEFLVADNEGESSSILPMEDHAQMFPKVKFVSSLLLRSVSLPTLLKRENVNLEEFQALVLDTQGSELLILKGAEEIVRQFRFIKVEVPDFKAYRGCVLDRELSAYLNARGFREVARERYAYVKTVGSYSDVLFERKRP